MAGTQRLILMGFLLSTAIVGCSRTHYRLRADRDAYGILQQKTAHAAWAPAPDFTVQPSPNSRFFDPTNPDDPSLPVPAPQLYGYQLPPLPTRDARRFQSDADIGETGSIRAKHGILRIPSFDAETGDAVETTAFLQPVKAPPAQSADLEPTPRTDDVGDTATAAETDEYSPSGQLLLVPIPSSVWESLPAECLTRMFEFASVREEYFRSRGREPSPELRDVSQKLALEDILELALINSREYQLQKEALYRVALQLTLERYDYELKFTPGLNATDVIFDHRRDLGITENSVNVPTVTGVEKVLATGGNLVARFANDVLLTFNGPDGFAADVGSELIADLTQSVFQRDIVFEQLTQSERDVVYAARDFARFRKVFFRDLAALYYRLILTFRGIEIDTQDYFSFVRGFNQAEAEYRADRLPRFQVDQFEQDALRSRSRLISSCNNLAQSLDNLKLQIGLPPETPINLDLRELEQITAEDRFTVTAELVRRARRNLISEQQEDSPNPIVLLNGAINLTRRMLELRQSQRELGRQTQSEEPLRILLAQLLVDEAQSEVDLRREVLQRESQATPPPPPVFLFQRAVDLISWLLTLAERHIEFATMVGRQQPQHSQGLELLRQEFQRLQNDLEQTVAARQLDQIPQLVGRSRELLQSIDRFVNDVRQVTRESSDASQQSTGTALEESGRLLAGDVGGLSPIEIGMDDAMLTALVNRFDLMNQRGELADIWRRIKLAGDDLKSILDLRSIQTIRTRADVNRPFDFSFDESRTLLSARFDAPLNRRAQRNAYRGSLINYQVALRNLIQAEDDIKFAVRNDLRDLKLDREQYQIAVASAALAYERRISTRIELRLGRPGVRARDVLLAQEAYTESLSAVAAERIGYILDRIQLFLDLELLTVNEVGFWPELYNDGLQPQPDFQFPKYGDPAYGNLPSGVHYSKRIRRMERVPSGIPAVNSTRPTAGDGQTEELPAHRSLDGTTAADDAPI